MVRPERFELPTLWFVAKYSIQLSYGRTLSTLSYYQIFFSTGICGNLRTIPTNRP
jgi:hypothetical protein